MDPVLLQMLEAHGRSEGGESAYWLRLGRQHLDQLIHEGYGDFKQTVARNYFTWIQGLGDPQVLFLARNLPLSTLSRIAIGSILSPVHARFRHGESFRYNLVTRLLYEYVRRGDCGDHLARVAEPLEGNPPAVRVHGRMVSQDLIHSVLDYCAVAGTLPDDAVPRRALEIGAGYGRSAYVFLTLRPDLQYLIADIPPALYIAQRYLTSQFPERSAFRFREFDSFEEVREELGAAGIAFLMPHQLELLPDRWVDLSMAIDCLHEMPPVVIERYFAAVDRITRGHFYFKCWKHTVIPFDQIELSETDYPIRPGWRLRFWRDVDLLTYPTWLEGRNVEGRYFEAMFALPGG